MTHARPIYGPRVLKRTKKRKKILNPFIVTVTEVQDRMRSVRLPANGRKGKESGAKRARQGSDSQRYLENGKNGHRTNRKRDRSHQPQRTISVPKPMAEVFLIDTFSCFKRKSGLKFSLFCFTDIVLGIVVRANDTNLDNMDSAQESFLPSSSEGRQEQISVSEDETCRRCGGEVSGKGAYC